MLNKTAIVTGGSSGIGRYICENLSSNGYKIINFDIKKFSKKNIFFFSTNLRNLNSIKKNFDYVSKKFQNISILINNAAISKSNNFEEYKLKDWKNTFEVNLLAPFYLSQIFSKFLIKKKIKGSIVNMTSIGAELAFPGNPAYQSSKAGLKHLTKSMAYDLAKYKIRVNNLVPGYTKFGMNKKSWANLKLRKARSKRSLLNRWAEPKEIYNGILYLIDENSGFVTGTDLIIDGGWTTKGL